MKKLIALALAALLLAGAALAEEDDWYLDTAKALAARVGELAGDDAFLELNAAAEIEGLDALRGVDFQTPAAGWRIEWTAIGDLMLSLYSAVELDGLSDAGRERVEQIMGQSLLSSANAQQGAEWLAIASVLTYGKTFAMPEGFEPCVYLLQFDGAAVGVAFVQTGEETITASAMPVAMGEAASAEEWISAMGYPSAVLSAEPVL